MRLIIDKIVSHGVYLTSRSGAHVRKGARLCAPLRGQRARGNQKRPCFRKGLSAYPQLLDTSSGYRRVPAFAFVFGRTAAFAGIFAFDAPLLDALLPTALHTVSVISRVTT